LTGSRSAARPEVTPRRRGPRSWDARASPCAGSPRASPSA
jgi:hypothetical protein